ncbi:uncharacterized protein [Nicotiana sylvestris]|uniref:uncharacterized protein n=1 Tax=Nicotiana sylvestris TaxID=4096 RepID=UPI00388C422D
MGEHEQNLRLVLQTLREQKLYAKFSKCEFWLDSMAFLGNGVLGGGIKMDPRKIEGVQSWPRPTIATEIRSFLGLVGYYRWFMEGFSSIAAPLTRLTQKGASFRRSDNCKVSFQKLKTTLTTTPVLVLPSGSGMWLELLKDDDITIIYHPRKVNVVVDALSKKAESIGSLAFISAYERPLAWDIQLLANKLMRDTVLLSGSKEVTIGDDGVQRVQGRLCVPNVNRLREKILEEAHSSRYSIHPGATKMYRDLRQHYWWWRMKDIVEYVARCLNFQRVKYEQQRLGGKVTTINQSIT